MIDSDPAVAPTIAGTVSGQTTTSETPVKPFAHVTIGDANVGATDTLTITLGGAGGTLSGTGLSGGRRRRLHAVGNRGRDHQRTRRARLHAEGGSAQHVLDDDVHAQRSEQRRRRAGRRQHDQRDRQRPGGRADDCRDGSGLTTTSETPVKPFAHATVGDANVGATDTLTITLGGAGGTLSGTGLSGERRRLHAVGTAAAITSELDALVFTPRRERQHVLDDDVHAQRSEQRRRRARRRQHDQRDRQRPGGRADDCRDGSGLTTTSEAPVKPFAHATVGDANVGATDTLTITLGGAGGTLTERAERRTRRRLHAVRNRGRDHQRTRRPRLHAEGGSAQHVLDDDVHAQRSEQRRRRARRRQHDQRDRQRPGGRADHCRDGVRPDDNVGGAGQAVRACDGRRRQRRRDRHADDHPRRRGRDARRRHGLQQPDDRGAGVYTLSGTAAAITSELDALVFTPKAGAPNTSSTTTFTLSDQSSAGGAPVVDSTTSVIDNDPCDSVGGNGANGRSLLLSLSNSAIVELANSRVTLSGSNDTVTMGAGSNLTVSGSNDAITATTTTRSRSSRGRATRSRLTPARATRLPARASPSAPPRGPRSRSGATASPGRWITSTARARASRFRPNRTWRSTDRATR